MLREYECDSHADTAWSQTMQLFTDLWDAVAPAMFEIHQASALLRASNNVLESSAPDSDALFIGAVLTRLQLQDDFVRLLSQRHWLIRGYVAAANERHMRQHSQVRGALYAQSVSAVCCMRQRILSMIAAALLLPAR